MLEAIITLFSVNTTFFTVLGYPMSYIEFFGTILYIWSAWLIAKKNMWTWPIGLVSVVLYMVLFYQIRLYSDALEQFYYIGATFYGWWFWQKNLNEKSKNSVRIRFSKPKTIWIWIGVTVVGTALLTWFISNIHILLPQYFPEKASFPFLDAFTTVMSFVAMFLMSQKRTENWVYWIIVDLIGIVLYYVKDVKFISLVYVGLLFIASNGLLTWTKETHPKLLKRLHINFV